MHLVKIPNQKATHSGPGKPGRCSKIVTHGKTGKAIATTITPLGQEGSHGVVIVLHDVTSLYRSERAMRETITHVSHDLQDSTDSDCRFSQTVWKDQEVVVRSIQNI